MIRTRVKLTISLTVVSMVLGFMISLQYRQTESNRLSQVPKDTEEKRLLAQLTSLKKSNLAMEEQLSKITANLAKYEKQSVGTNTGLARLQAKLQAERILSGLTPVEGPGVAVTLMDGQGANTEQVLTHDWDVRQVINELFTAGGEAVSINGYRVVATSGIYCTGPVVRINDHRIGAPFLIEAIGDPNALKSALNIPGGILDKLRTRGVNASDPQIEQSITMPAFTGSSTTQVANTSGS